MKQPAVSIIVPCYNAEKTIDRCMESLTGQRHTNIEIIAVDDGSTDGTWLKLKEWARRDSRIDFYGHDDIGQARTVNEAVGRCHGIYIAECDSDDWADPGMYGKLWTVAAQTGFPDMVRCGMREIFRDGERETPMCPDILDGMVLGKKEIMNPKMWPAVFGRQCSIPSGIYRREFVTWNGLYYRPDHNFEDTSLEFRLRASANSMVMIADCLYNYNRSNPSSGSETIKDRFAICEQVAEMLRFNAEKNLGLEGYINAYRFYLYRWNLDRLKTEEDIRAFAERMQRDFVFNPPDPAFFNSEQDRRTFEMIRGF